MRTFAHFNARTVDEVVSILRRYGERAHVIAGGTDLLGKMKDELLPKYPEALVNIKSIPGLEYIREDHGTLQIGALTRLEDIAADPLVRGKYNALAEATRRAASPHLREMGTLGGNICQDIRCWYYRHPDNRFPCLRKGGGRCYAMNGENRYHSIFGANVEQGCYAVHPSDTAPALIALNAKVKTSRRTLAVEDLFEVRVGKTTVLDSDEIVTAFEVPTPAKATKSSFVKFALRKTIDFPIVNCAAMIASEGGRVTAARVCLNAVYVKPYRATKAEEFMAGQPINEANAEAAGDAVVSDAKPLQHNGYMVQIAKVMVKRAILACRSEAPPAQT
ncbi:MAG: FAD binding domain-containing protein [Desulfobacterales bacterium]|nr:MAG: FAD binding domain-containing protein [Desulfobacterales bacterium]